jgi:cell filamentation protein, protein adenylyltransferase
LRQEDFAPNAPGRLVRSPQGYWTFEPAPLPPDFPFDLGLIRQLSEADRALGELAGLGRRLPNPHLLIRPFLRREAVLSSRIEGTVTRLDQLFLFESDADEVAHPADVAEVANYVHALEYGLQQLGEGLPLCWRLLREVHARLMQGVRGENKRPGQFRNCDVLIGRPGQSWDDARFVPPAHTALDPLLRHFEQFLNDPGALSPVVQIALAHYQFETLHPFMDGNGRLGRLLITLMLCAESVLPQPLLYLSAFLERRSQDYKDRMLEVSRQGAWAEWVRFFARGVAEQAHDAVDRAARLLDLWQVYRVRVREASQSSAALRLLDELFAAPFLTIPRAAQLLEVTFPTAQSNMKKLEDLGILHEITGHKRNRIYQAREILALLDAVPAEEKAE